MKFPQISTKDRLKFYAAFEAVKQVEHGMIIGLGTGSTANWFVYLLAERIHNEGLELMCCTTSSGTWNLAESLGVPLCQLDDVRDMAFVVDGADESDHRLSLIKGGGGALLQEKIVAKAAERMIVIADDSKLVETLGQFPLPVEVVQFGWQTTMRAVQDLLGADVTIKRREKDGSAFVTDEGHFILDCYCGQITDAPLLEKALNMIPGVVENGLFIGIASELILGHADGTVMVHKNGGAQSIALDVPSTYVFID